MKKRVNIQSSRVHRKGVALLVVLFIVMAITIVSLGYLSRSDVELACGRNMDLRTQMDYLAESGLEHARGLILNPQEIEAEYWTGSSAQQLVAGSTEYYDVNVARDDSDPTDRCNYTIDCNAYMMDGGEKVGRSEITAELRLDPCIALWTGNDTTIWSGVTVNGDVRCNGAFVNAGTMRGDVFADSLSGNDIIGQLKSAADLSLTWPPVTVAAFTSNYTTQTISTGTVSNETFGPYTPVRVCYRNGNLVLAGNVRVEGMLVVNGNLSVYGNTNTITAAKKLPALLVTGDLIVTGGARLDVNGLAVVDGTVQLSADNSDVNCLGGMFTQRALGEIAEDSSGHGRSGALYGGPTWQPSGGRLNGALSFDGQNDTVQDMAAGAYLNGLSAMTLAVWIKSDVTDEDRGIVFTRTPTGEDRELGIRYDGGGASGGPSGITASIQTTSGFTQIESSPDIQTTNWQHLALTWESDPNDSHLKLYVNGALNALRYDMGSVYGTTAGVQKLMLGCGTKDSYWDGCIDDLQVYNRALSVAEIGIVRAGGAVSGLICHWRLDESGGHVTVTAAPTKTAIQTWSEMGDASKWGQAAGAFFKSIERR